ncbi:hypothetical protein OJAV_G00003650 [Oryzias javanicus]|uniref:Uncharacterized protein n=1 Tax=Oryzias javanicus TaxID=123683 RepID=A0A3S2N7H2_ORYJA|nr:hypothetical protein OJAV_G00003650 [Oryzias javanicus]
MKTEERITKTTTGQRWRRLQQWDVHWRPDPRITKRRQGRAATASSPFIPTGRAPATRTGTTAPTSAISTSGLACLKLSWRSSSARNGQRSEQMSGLYLNHQIQAFSTLDSQPDKNESSLEESDTEGGRTAAAAAAACFPACLSVCGCWLLKSDSIPNAVDYGERALRHG